MVCSTLLSLLEATALDNFILLEDEPTVPFPVTLPSRLIDSRLLPLTLFLLLDLCDFCIQIHQLDVLEKYLMLLCLYLHNHLDHKFVLDIL